MTALILNGKELATQIEQELSRRVRELKEKTGGKPPILATILVGDDPASATYVRMKGNACKRVGMESWRIVLPQTATTEELLGEIDRLNADSTIHGVLLQHPVPPQIAERECFDRISLEKDVDGVTCHGFGRMAMNESAYGSATPAGVMRLLEHYGVPLEGKVAAVVGRSPILGKPMAMMLLNANVATLMAQTVEAAERNM
jgi:methylenetetrahydrofolate dehydrogenase (NADP+)/methenyltetrahydrofolate cyclohydrolase